MCVKGRVDVCEGEGTMTCAHSKRRRTAYKLCTLFTVVHLGHYNIYHAVLNHPLI